MRTFIALCMLVACCQTFAETTYLALYLKGSKIGYASYASANSTYMGKSAVESISTTVMDTSLLGTSMVIRMDSKSWTTKSGNPLRMWSDTRSGGRTSKVDAIFGVKSVAMHIVNEGIFSDRSLPIPVGVPVVDDPLTLVLGRGMKVGSTKSFYVLDPMTASFIKNDVKFVGNAVTTVNGKSRHAKLIEVTDTRSSMRVFVGMKGELVRVDGPAGIYMLPVSRSVALAKNSEYASSTDLAYSTSLKPDKTIEDPAETTRLKLRIVGPDLSRAPSDTHQTITKSGPGWLVDVHPVKVRTEAAVPISVAAKSKAAWLQPSLYIPCRASRFLQLSAKVVGGKKDVPSATLAIQRFVYENMKPNAGIGVLRDATDVLNSKEGVCRDYAILTVTLLRAAQIPARLASGLVNWDGEFYYHAWAEAWDGSNWIGVDSTTDQAQVSACHIKLGDGNVDTAFSFTFLEKAKLQVLEARKE
ncbi:MAG: transglutaminase-like domain-containing protein [Fimbriimonas sp.]|nr:transglutaminase-like domain-containing protein [Fimbriimonas sp.]